ncbi:MAG: DUF2911 domain-containing protein [Bacteroidia bacterium]|nr:DUF2911 domain-containing protein [Bacteroidia bacterium]
MKSYIIITWIAMLLLISCQNQNRQEQKDQHHHEPAVQAETLPENTKKSIPKEAHGQVGNVHVSISYYSPGVRGRIIYGGLVPFGEVWVTGAHSATKVSFSENIEIEGTSIPKGDYAIFTIPGEEKWTFILNKNWEQHLADDYKQEEDVIRVELTPEVDLPIAERLIYNIEDKGNGKGIIKIQWEKRSISLPFEEIIAH